MGLKEILGETVQGKEGDVAVSSFDTEDYVVGIYFSAHWCPPCRGFTPVLAEAYKNISNAGKKLEIVFVSSDRDQAGFDGYYKDMPWKALPFTNSEKKNELAEKFNVRGIPMLVLMRGGTGEIITPDGRSRVMKDETGDRFPESWVNP